MPALDVVVGRQAIFDRNFRVLGYELLFRALAGDHRAMADIGGDLMTCEVLFSSLNIGIENLVGNKLVFCNADRGLLTGSIPVTLPPERTVIEVLETVRIDAEVLAGCRDLVSKGFRLALDDFTWFEGAEELIKLAWIVKLDLRLVNPDELELLVARCRQFDVKLLAEKIETEAELKHCRDLGFDYFQGYLLGRPRIVPGRTLETSQLGRMRLAAQLVCSEPDFDEIERIVRVEPGMTFQVLQMASLGLQDGTRREVSTLRQALVIVGVRRMASWVALLLLTRRGATQHEAFATALIRARMCELLAASSGVEGGSMAYTAGLLSAFDLLLGVPIKQVMQALPLDERLMQAVFEGNGPLGQLVHDVVAFENCHVVSSELLHRYGLGLHLASMRAISYATEATQGWEVPASRARAERAV